MFRLVQLCAGLGTVLAGTLSAPTHSVAKLSQARRNLGATTLGEHAFFVGGCTNTGTDVKTQFICDKASDVIDMLDATGSIVQNAKLSDARGWVEVCPLDHLVVMAGGGTSGTKPHSRRADVYNTRTGKMTVNETALHDGVWGTACVSSGSSVYYMGGKVTISGYDNAHMSSVINVASIGKGWSVAPFNLSRQRESVAALEFDGMLISAGGWTKDDAFCRGIPGSPYCGDPSVDVFFAPFSEGKRKTFQTDTAIYDAGRAVVGTTGLVVGDKSWYVFKRNGDDLNMSKHPLPADMQGPTATLTSQVRGILGGGVIPASHVPQNGVVVGNLACFYGASPSRLYCLDTTAEDASQQWSRFDCSAVHQGGSIVAVGNTVMVAGGFDPASPTYQPTDVVDVFDFGAQPSFGTIV